MNYPDEYIQFLIHFHGDRDYFECHEVLEEYWKRVDRGNRESIWVGLIQLAVALYHYRRGNIKGAYRTLTKSLAILSSKPKTLNQIGLDEKMVINQVKELRLSIEKELPYVSINLAIVDQDLINLCQNKCTENGYTWCNKSDLLNTDLINRHSLRDRTDVITARKKALELKKIKQSARNHKSN
ncbi:putative metal-dependent hydrolase [Bacillus pakistanensis]|uniref:Metal-dependent hydrolase n=1 Tax=Rossellomorea pakistanensis TaxID=992288 RepID=A0ABS2N988_9BACI|nr:DUF309 domain-containing protein [Bacillus pakistanensis]MBM7584408.1 putative metal-dependent hydrolase [Bacillus pakistanensis]